MASAFATQFTYANLAEDATQYDRTPFLAWNAQLMEVIEEPYLALGILTAILVAQKRGDTVAALFNDITEKQSAPELEATFMKVREALVLALPFVGLPNIMPAAFGLVEALGQRNVDGVHRLSRGDIRDLDYLSKGRETSQAIYHGVGNTVVQHMIGQYFPDILYYAHATIFGYLIGNSPVLSLKDAELVVAASILGLGATRQARSHCKGAMGLGNSVEILTVVVQIAGEIADWNKQPLPGKIDVLQLWDELQSTLAQDG